MLYEQSLSYVAVFDSNPILALGLCSLLGQTPHLEGRALTITDPGHISLPQGYSPDVVLVDPAQTGLSPTELMSRLSGPGDPIAVVGYASRLDPDTVKASVAAGFRGFLPKTASLTTLHSVIDAVISGGIYLDPEAARMLVPDNTAISARLSAPDLLSGRERDVLKSVALGMSTKEIGSAMALSAKTIETYKARASNKLNLKNRRDIVNFAIRNGWVQALA